MNIPIEIARPQGKHGSKGGRPRLDRTDEERAERRRKQKEAYRRRKGIPPRTKKPNRWDTLYVKIWGKPPGEPLTPEEFAPRVHLWDQWVIGNGGS